MTLLTRRNPVVIRRIGAKPEVICTREESNKTVKAGKPFSLSTTEAERREAAVDRLIETYDKRGLASIIVSQWADLDKENGIAAKARNHAIKLAEQLAVARNR